MAIGGTTTRRGVILGTAAIAAARPLSALAQAQTITVATSGGNYLATQKRHFFGPFEKETGIRVQVANEPSLAALKTMVQAGSVDWDVGLLSMSELLISQRENLLEAIDYSVFPANLKQELIPEIMLPYGVGTCVVGHVVSFNTKAFAGGRVPRSWRDLWDTKNFPGPRALNAMDFGARPLEIPLLADGVETAALYPLDIDRAFRSLDRLRPSVVKWVTRGVDVSDLLARGEIVISHASSARIVAARDQGAAVDFSPEQALLLPDMWVVAKGTPNAQNAMKFIRYVSGAQAQAGFSAEYPLGPTNTRAMKLLSASQVARLPNASGAIVRDAAWWDSKEASGRSNTDVVAERWRRWVL